MDSEPASSLINRVAMGDTLRRRARSSGDAVALADYGVDPPQLMTYRQLHLRSNRMARALMDHGASKGDRVTLLSPNCNDVPAVMYACLKAGLVYVPLNTSMGEEDLGYIVGHAAPSCAIVHPAFVETWDRIGKNLPAGSRTFVLGGEDRGDVPALEPLLDAVSSDDILDVAIADRDPAQILYTSGTTSRPKGALHTHLSMTLWSLSMALAFEMAQGDSELCPLPLFHIGGESHMLMCHQVGGTFAYAPFEPALYAHVIEKERVAGIFLLPMMWKALLDLPDIERRDFKSLKWALYAMAPMSDQVLNRLRQVFGAKFLQASGQTETSIMTLFDSGSDTQFPGGNYWGRPIATAEQAVLGEDGQELEPGEVGEICWRGPTIQSAYYKNEAASAEAVRHDWHHSGDLGLIDGNGQLLFVDRKKDMVKSGGENVSSIRVEQVICGVKDVTAVAVIGLPHPKWGEAVSAFVTVRSGATTTADEIAEACRGKLSRYEIPKHIEIVAALPMTSSGKVLKHELRKRHAGLYGDGSAGS
ncbi:MAG: AMP-binding protein [Rhizobiaceae bacterium]